MTLNDRQDGICRIMIEPIGAQKYIEMQRSLYEHAASQSKYDQWDKIDGVVGSYNAHNQWPDYDRYLMRYIDASFKQKRALDFACGPGRNIVKYSHLFAELDGADISAVNLENAKKNLSYHGVPEPRLFLTNGNDLGDAPDNFYDFVFSTIAMQHICVHEIRFSLLSHMYRSLRKLGRLSIQMGFGVKPGGVPYYDNFYEAPGTNSLADAMVENPDYVEDDLRKIGFQSFEYWVRPTGPGDNHPFWIFFTGVK